jgi:hypothetical protein
VEKQIFEHHTDPILDYLDSYIDDSLGKASCSRVELQRFINFVNNFHPALQFVWEINEVSISFSNILVSINDYKLFTSVFCKPLQASKASQNP